MRLQPFRFAYFDLKHAGMSIGARKLREARDFQVLSYSGSGRASGRLHRLASGCTSDEFAGLSAGEIPLVDRIVSASELHRPPSGFAAAAVGE